MSFLMHPFSNLECEDTHAMVIQHVQKSSAILNMFKYTVICVG